MSDTTHSYISPKDQQALRERMTSIHISRINEMPRIELYLDQVLSLVSDELSWMALPGEELLTGSMVNNYVKQKLVPAPLHRRYTRRHVATLIFVCTFKRFFSIADVKRLYEVCLAQEINVASTYDELVSALERTMAARFGTQGNTMASPTIKLLDTDGAEVAPDLVHLMNAGIEAIADKVLVEQSLKLFHNTK